MTAGGSPKRTTRTVSADGALAWLYGFSDLERGVGWNRASSPRLEFNLRRTRILLDLAGAPDRRMVCVLIAGTKGKGSTAALLASLLSASGVRAGLYTQPHLQSYRERVRVEGRMIGARAFAAGVARLRPRVVRLRRILRSAGAPTTFELTTALALEHFAAARCAVAVIEVGLGGRYDATNAVDPHVSVITPVSRDHTRILGTRLERIATEKAGILRPGRVAVVAGQRPEARAAILRACERVGAEPRIVTARAEREPAVARTALRGAHQRTNAAVAIATARALAEHGVLFDERRAGAALARLRWPGRFELVGVRPTIVLDGAHNDASAEALARALRQAFPRARVRFVLGVMADKDARAIVRALLPLASAVEVTRAASVRALDPAALARLVRGVPVRVHADVAAALAAARADAGPDEVVCVTGSLALVGAARDALRLPALERLW